MVDEGAIMELKNLTTFIQVAELGSFTRAAASLGYSQSTVSFQIKQLEAELNIQLFERINHTVTLTEKGKDILNRAHEIVRLAEDMTVQETGERRVSGNVRLAMADSLCSCVLERSFIDFRKRYPEITLKVIAGDTTEMFRLLDHNEVDMVFTLDKHIYDREYIIAGEEKIQTHFVAASSHPLAQRRELSVSELIAEPFILTEKGMSYRRLMDEKLASRSLEVNPILELGNVALICCLVAQGAGISFLPDYTTARHVRDGAISYLNVTDFDVEVWEQLLYHKDKWVTPQMQAVMTSCLAETVGEGRK